MKKIVYLVLGVLILGGLAYTVTQTSWLKGDLKMVVGTNEDLTTLDEKGLLDLKTNIYRDGLQLAEPVSIDSDGDKLPNDLETKVIGTDPNDADTDDDGIEDGQELNKTNTYITDPTLADTDGGGVDDGTEVKVDKTDPTNAADDKLAAVDPSADPVNFSIKEISYNESNDYFYAQVCAENTDDPNYDSTIANVLTIQTNGVSYETSFTDIDEGCVSLSNEKTASGDYGIDLTVGGDYGVIATIDTPNRHTESIEDDNTWRETISFESSTPAELATLNFIAKKLTTSSSSVTAVVVTICTENLESNPKADSIQTDVKFEAENATDGTKLDAVVNFDPSEDGCESVETDLSAITEKSDWGVIVTVDPDNAYKESNEKDNKLTGTLTLGEDAAEAVKTDTYACTELNIDPDAYTFETDGEDVEFSVSVLVESTSPTSSIFHPFNAMTDVFAFILPPKPTDWKAALIIDSDGDGTFVSSTGKTGAHLEIPIEADDVLTFTYKGGSAGDTITAYLKEEKDCNDQLTLEAATQEQEKTEPLICTSLDITPNTYTLPTGETVMDFSVEVEATDYTDGATSFLSHLYTSLLSFTIVDIDWEGYLVIESSNSSGSFSNDENGDTGNPVEIDLKGSGNLVNATYSNAAAGDTITAYIKGEEQACSDTLVLEAEEVVDEDVPEEEVVVVEEVIEEEPEEEEEEEEVVVVVEDEEGDYDFDAITAAREDLCTQPFDDVSEGDWAYYYIWRMFCTNVVQGRTYNTYFVPTGDTTRAEALKVLMLLSGHTTDDASGKSESYKDVDSNDWFYPYYVLAYEENIVRGEYAHPDDPITRGDYVVYMMRIANQTLWGWDESDIPFSDLSKSDYYTYAIIIGYNKIVVDPDSGDEVRVFGGYSNGTSGAKNTIARNEAMALALRFYLAYYAD